MRTTLQPGQRLPDFTLPDHTGKSVGRSNFSTIGEFQRRLGFTEGRPLIVVFYRGYFCPRDHRQLSQLVSFYPEIQLNYASLGVISVDAPRVAAAYRAGLGAEFSFLSDADRAVIKQLGIVDNTYGEYPNIAIPHTFCLRPDLTIFKIYTGWWLAGRPSVEELRQDLRVLMQERADYPHAAWDTLRVKSVRIPAAYWAGQKDAVELNVVGKGKGQVLWFSAGQGLIKADDGEELFVHFTGIPGRGDRSLSPGQAVEFDIVEGLQSRYAARVRHVLHIRHARHGRRAGSV